MPAVSQASVHSQFQRQVERLAAHAAASADAVTPRFVRAWYPVGVSPLDIPAMTGAFNRSEINANYTQALSDPERAGTAGDAISLKLQCDYVAAMERAYLARVATPVRCLVHAAARRGGHAFDDGVLRGGVLNYAQTVIKAGQQGATP